jgi:ferritin-like protein
MRSTGLGVLAILVLLSPALIPAAAQQFKRPGGGGSAAPAAPRISVPAAPHISAPAFSARRFSAPAPHFAAVGDPRHVAEITQIPRAPNGCEEVPAMLSRLLEAHELILIDAHEAAAKVAELGDNGTNDLMVSDVIRTGELQAWFLVEHLVDTPLVRA